MNLEKKIESCHDIIGEVSTQKEPISNVIKKEAVSQIITDLIVFRNNGGRYLSQDKINELISSFPMEDKIDILFNVLFGLTEYLSLKPRDKAVNHDV